jgi:hypothetical protein
MLYTLLRCGSRVGSGMTHTRHAIKAANAAMSIAGTLRKSRIDILSSESKIGSASYK